MRLYEHRRALARMHNNQRTLRKMALQVVLWTIAGAGILFLGPLLAQCGDVEANDFGGGEESGRDGLAPARVAAALVDPAAFALAARMLAWQPTWRARHEGELEAVAMAIVEACSSPQPWPDRERCHDLMGALAFRESSLHPESVGARGELGAWQLHGLALAGETRAAAMDVNRNAVLAQRWLWAADAMCRRAGWATGLDFETRVLGAYGSGRCIPYRGARLVQRWAEELRTAGGES